MSPTGSYLGLVYANMFPGRVRAIAIDGIVNPLALAGTPATAHVPVLDRMGSAAASYRALRELLGADSRNAAAATSWPAAAAAADRRARYFGAFYAWLTVQCARHTWTARDRDAYQGPFDRRTAAPVLVIGGKWDPATSYGNAVTVARLLPNSRLVASGSWGHEAAGTSACVDDTLWDYLIQPQAPAPKVTRCRGNVQPFGPAPSAR